MIEQVLAEQSRLMDEALARACKLGRPFTEMEVFEFVWAQKYDLHCAQDDRFQLYQEGWWKGTGEKKKFHPRLWIVRDTSDERAHVEDAIRTGEFEHIDFEFPVVERRLSLRVTAKVDGEEGNLEIYTDNGIEGFSIEEALGLRDLLNDAYKMLYALANQE